MPLRLPTVTKNKKRMSSGFVEVTNLAGNAKCHRKEARLPWFISYCPSLNFVQRCPGLNQRSPGLLCCRGLEHIQNKKALVQEIRVSHTSS